MDRALDWLIKNNPFFKDIKKDPNWHILDPNDPDDQLLSMLLKKDEDVSNDIELHEEENDDKQDKETPKKETEEEVYEGKGLLYDTVFVDNIPSLPEQSPTFPVREDGNAFAIAPGEGQTPISRRTENLNQLAFPGMFPYGECQLEMAREVPLHEGRYINSLIMRQNGRHHKPYFVFHAENQNEHRQLQSSINFQSRKSFGGKLKTQKDLEEATKGNKAWTVFKQNRTTPGY